MISRKQITAIIMLISLMPSSLTATFAGGRYRELKVMTYNMYLGADLFDIFSAPPDEVFLEVGEAYSDMLAGNVPERIVAIADQIEDGQPTIVGLQEVALWKIGAPFDPAPATTVTYDFLQMLMDELVLRDLPYAPVVVQTNLQAELPGVFTNPPGALDIQYTDRLVILARTDLPESEFKLEGSNASSFVTNITVPVLGQNVTVLRGWTSVDVKFRGKPYRFINTHLESFSELVQQVQAGEILQGPAATDSAIVLVGDFNSDAEASGVTYGILTGAGMRDVWEEVNPGLPGFTWALSGEIPSNELMPTQRLDLILVRGPVSSLQADVVGEEAADKTPSNFRPSDHAGLTATIVLQP